MSALQGLLRRLGAMARALGAAGRRMKTGAALAARAAWAALAAWVARVARVALAALVALATRGRKAGRGVLSLASRLVSRGWRQLREWERQTGRPLLAAAGRGLYRHCRRLAGKGWGCLVRGAQQARKGAGQLLWLLQYLWQRLWQGFWQGFWAALRLLLRLWQGFWQGFWAALRLLLRLLQHLWQGFRAALRLLLRLLQHLWQGFRAALRLWGARGRQQLRRLAVYGPPLQERVCQYAALIRLDKPIGWLLLLWPCLWALWIAAEGLPDLHILAVFLCGVFLMRSAGAALNDIADRHFDSQVQRTRNRPLATGAITPLEALSVAMALLLTAFLLAAWFLNTLTLLLALVALLLAATYPFMKRFTWLPQLYLGLAFAWGIPMAFAAQTGQVPVIAWALLVTSILWTASYDTIYALMDREDDQRIGVKSTAILLADADLVFIAAMLFLFNAAWLAIAWTLQLGGWFYLAWLAALGNNIYQLWLIREREPGRCMQAFSSNNYCGMFLFFGIALHYGAPPV